MAPILELGAGLAWQRAGDFTSDGGILGGFPAAWRMGRHPTGSCGHDAEALPVSVDSAAARRGPPGR
jgi:hypothetical protein